MLTIRPAFHAPNPFPEEPRRLVAHARKDVATHPQCEGRARVSKPLLDYHGVDARPKDAHHMAAPLPSGAQAVRAMRCALQEAEVLPEAVDYIDAHASSTPLNDVTETLAIKQVFEDHAYRVPLSGTKAMHGHVLGATGRSRRRSACRRCGTPICCPRSTRPCL